MKTLKAALSFILMVFTLCVTISAYAEEHKKCYLNDNVYIENTISETDSTAGTYIGTVQTWSLDDLISILQLDDFKDCVPEKRESELVLSHNDDLLSITAADGNEPFETMNISYMSSKLDKYDFIFQSYARALAGLETSSELSFLSQEDVVNRYTAILEQLLPGMTPVCSEIWGYSVEDLNTVRGWLSENDEMYMAFLESGKIADTADFETGDEAYTVLFTFELNGIPVFDCNDVGLNYYSDNEKALANEMYCSISITKDGIIDFSLMNCVSISSKESESALISAMDAASIAAQRYEDVIRTTPVILSDVKLEYMPLIQDDGTIYFVPTWYFRAASEDNPRLTLEACRINAITGEILN